MTQVRIPIKINFTLFDFFKVPRAKIHAKEDIMNKKNGIDNMV